MTISNNSFYKLIKVESNRNATPSDGNPSWWSWDTTSKTNYRNNLIQQAIDLGGDLVTINDDAELNFLRTEFGGTNNTWLQSYAYNEIGELSRFLIDGDGDQYWGYSHQKYLMPWGGTYNGGQYNTGDGNISHGDSTYGHAPEHVIAEVPLSYFSISDLTITEGDSGNVIISRTGGSKATQTLTLTSSNDSAISGSDYSAINQTVSFEADETSKTISISTLNDVLIDPFETFTLTISSTGTDDVPPQFTDNISTVTIYDDDGIINGSSFYKVVMDHLGKMRKQML